MTYVCNITKTQSHNGRRIKTRAYSLTKNHGVFGTTDESDSKDGD